MIQDGAGPRPVLHIRTRPHVRINTKRAGARKPRSYGSRNPSDKTRLYWYYA